MLSALITREVKDPRVGNVTVTAVSMAADKSSARIFFTPFASSNPPEQVRLGLTHAAGYLRGELGRRLGLRHAPRLEFVFDASVGRGRAADAPHRGARWRGIAPQIRSRPPAYPAAPMPPRR